MAFPGANLCSLCRSIPFHDLPPFPDALFSCTPSGKHYLQKLIHSEIYSQAPVPDPLGFQHHPDLASLRAASAAGCELCREIERLADGVLADIADWEQTYSKYSGWSGRRDDPSFELWITRRGDFEKEKKRFSESHGDVKADGFWVSTRSKSYPNEWFFTVATFGYCVEGDNNPLAVEFPGRPILGTPVEDGVLDRIVGWVRECDEHHDGCAVGEAELPTRLLDLGEQSATSDASQPTVHLVEPDPGTRGRYAALSYCWGTDSKPYVTTRAVLESRKAPGGIDLATLPNTFLDAITLARRLGIRYLWVDSLCICQDDIHDWERESARMAAVYSNAYLTIAATGSKDSSGGLFFPRPTRPYFRVDYGPTTNSSSMRESASPQPSILIFPLATVKEVLREYRIRMHGEPLTERGWAFQERVLSPRVLHFASDQACFECIQGIVYEDGLRMPRRFDHVKPEGVAGHEIVPSDVPVDTTLKYRYDMGRWYHIYGEYNQRKLTFPDDKLPALSGIAASFAARFGVDGSAYAAGIWRGEHMIESLCWQASGAVDYHGNGIPYDRKYIAPSWSWASVNGYAASVFSYQHRDVARVLDCVVDVDGDNPFGRVRDAWLRLEAPIIPLTLSDTVKGQTGDMCLTVVPGETRDEFCGYAQFDTMDHSYDHKAETVRKMQLFALVMAGGLPPANPAPKTGPDVAVNIYFCLIVTPAEGGWSEDRLSDILELALTLAMRLTLSALAAAAFASAVATATPVAPRQGDSIECAPIPSPWPTWQDLPRQPSLPDPFLPLRYTTKDNVQAVLTGRASGRVRTPEEWYKCRQPEIIRMLQEYQYGYYPDPAEERVEATRSGNTLNIAVTAGGKRGTFRATITLPQGASAQRPAPVVINIGGMQNQPYLNAGIAIAQFDYTSVAPDSNAKTGAFWSIYNGRDIGVLTAWAWGFHRTLDALNMTVPEIDPTRVGVTGCSRLGKAALAAGLFDKRITLTMPMSSGVQGLGPYRYYTLSGQGENLENSKQGAGWWTTNRLSAWLNRAEYLPYDAHTIAAAIAPRALVIDQGTGDPFVNSKGTAVAVFPAAKAVYEWLGHGDKIAISVRSGGHCDFSGFTSILPYVQKIFFGTPTTKDFNSLGSYGSPMTTAYPWATNLPKP
ncbi:hypothetical protein VTJ49DRAFT_2057 [Mycothermus thermophilus]|uniref:(4-O-methyl)-D-glucuronate--lignin esterase n=1 Tax=Humicola insolens TaxID=85995 RepID=A0ABR3VB36_HUMIN